MSPQPTSQDTIIASKHLPHRTDSFPALPRYLGILTLEKLGEGVKGYTYILPIN